MNHPLLKDKVAVVTGAAAGIGEAIARLFAEEGARVYALDIHAEAGEAVAVDIRAAGGSCAFFAADARRKETVEPAVDDAMSRFGRIDALINNAGIYPRRPFLEMTDEEWDEMLDINLKSVYVCTKLVVPHMVKQRSGKIVNISSVTFFKGLPNLSHYIASKGGMIGFTRSLAREMAPHGVYVNCIAPGGVQTENEGRVASKEEIARIVAQQALPRRLKPLDVARACLFLSSEWSDGIIGQTINVDGGAVMK